MERRVTIWWVEDSLGSGCEVEWQEWGEDEVWKVVKIEELPLEVGEWLKGVLWAKVDSGGWLLR
jgi:hypothetical protein